MHTVKKDFLRKKKSFTYISQPKNRENKNMIIAIKQFIFSHADSNKLFLKAKICKMSFNYLKQCPSNCITQFPNILHLYQLATVITSY